MLLTFLKRYSKESGSGSERHVYEYNLPRKVIKQYFNKRSCFCLPRPADEEKQLRNLDSLPVGDLRPIFIDAVDHLYCNVLQDAKPYAMKGISLTGTSVYNGISIFPLSNLLKPRHYKFYLNC